MPKIQSTPALSVVAIGSSHQRAECFTVMAEWVTLVLSNSEQLKLEALTLKAKKPPNWGPAIYAD